MQKTSQLFLILMTVISLLAAYTSLPADPASVAAGRFFALSAFFLVTVTLLMGPLAVIWPQRFSYLIEPRRAVGIASFPFMILHFVFSFGIQFAWDLPLILGALTFLSGAIPLAIFAVLALTSADWATKSMGPVFWKNLQRFNYLAFAAIVTHFLLNNNDIFSKLSEHSAELALLLFAAVTIGFQIAGFLVVRKRKKEAELKEKARKQMEAKPPEPPAVKDAHYSLEEGKIIISEKPEPKRTEAALLEKERIIEKFSPDPRELKKEE